jgi:hypothetical protein
MEEKSKIRLLDPSSDSPEKCLNSGVLKTWVSCENWISVEESGYKKRLLN